METNKIFDWAKKHYIITFIIIAGLLGAIIGDDTNTTKTIKESAEVQKNIVEVKKEDRCLDVPLELIKKIESGLNINGGGKLINVKAVKSKDFDKRYFISGYLEGKGISKNSTIAVFTVGDLDPSKTMIGSVNAIAKEFAVWPTPRIINNGNDGIIASKECLK